MGRRLLIVAQLTMSALAAAGLAHAEPATVGLSPPLSCPPLKPISHVEPVVAEEDADHSADVVVEFDVTRDGATSGVRVVESRWPGAFDRSVVDAVTKWRFAPSPDGYVKCRTRYASVGVRH